MTKSDEKKMEQLNKMGMKWYVLNHDFNTNKIELFNIFRSNNFLYGVVKALEKSNYEDFKNEINNWLMYSFWSKAEYEIVCGDLFVKQLEHLEKIDVYYQVKENVDILAKYILDEYNKRSKKKIKFPEKSRTIKYDQLIKLMEKGEAPNKILYKGITFNYLLTFADKKTRLEDIKKYGIWNNGAYMSENTDFLSDYIEEDDNDIIIIE